MQYHVVLSFDLRMACRKAEDSPNRVGHWPCVVPEQCSQGSRNVPNVTEQGWQRTVFGVRKTDVHVRCFVRRSVLNVFGILFGSCSCSAFGCCCVRVHVRIACSCSVRCSGHIHMMMLNVIVPYQCSMSLLNVNVECQC